MPQGGSCPCSYPLLLQHNLVELSFILAFHFLPLSSLDQCIFYASCCCLISSPRAMLLEPPVCRRGRERQRETGRHVHDSFVTLQNVIQKFQRWTNLRRTNLWIQLGIWIVGVSVPSLNALLRVSPLKGAEHDGNRAPPSSYAISPSEGSWCRSSNQCLNSS